jgi:AbrB family looped-hinge helix DNA binding protein
MVDYSKKYCIMHRKGVINMISMNLKNLRKKSKFTQEEVADKIGVSRQAVAKWENGETVPDINNSFALAELYGVSLDDLVRHSDDKNVLCPSPRGKHVFGIVKIDERGQMVIPKKARDIFHISPGDKIVVLGDEAQGIALLKYEQLKHFVDAIHQAEEDCAE